MNDSLNKILSDTGKVLENLQKKSRHAKRKKEIDSKVELLNTIGECKMNLEKCKVSLMRNAYTQAAAVRECMSNGVDSTAQKQILWDSAIGYLVADEAISALGTISGYDDLNRAYSMMEKIIARIGSSEENNVPDVKKIGLRGVIGLANADGKNIEITGAKRDGFGVRHEFTSEITSGERLNRHEAMVESFFSELIMTGDLKYLVDEARRAAYANSLEELYATQKTANDEPEVAAIDEIDEAEEIELDEPDIAPTVKNPPVKRSSRMFSIPTVDDTKKG